MDLSTICSFTRMQALLFTKVVSKPEQIPPAAVEQACLWTPLHRTSACYPERLLLVQVAAALSESQELQLSENKKRVRRVKPLDPEQATAEVDGRSIYASPFPHDVTLDGMMQFWNTVAPTRGVRLRRHAVSLDFRGSMFVELDSPQVQQEVRLLRHCELGHGGSRVAVQLECCGMHDCELCYRSAWPAGAGQAAGACRRSSGARTQGHLPHPQGRGAETESSPFGCSCSRGSSSSNKCHSSSKWLCSSWW